jgi:hypothetical protein
MTVTNLLIIAALYAGGAAVVPDCDENPTWISDYLAQQGIATDTDSLLREVVEEPRLWSRKTNKDAGGPK